MRPVIDRALGHAPRWAAIALAAFLLAACGASAPPASGPATAPVAATAPAASPAASQPATTPPPSAVPSPSPSAGPATATFALTGSAGLTGPVTPAEIVCGEPSFDGPQIFVLGKAGSSGPQVVLFIAAGHVEARVGTGAAATLRLRTFVGTGVTGFDAAKGAQLDTKLTESTAAGTAIGNLGALSAISGSIDCGDQQPGSATIVVSGMTPLGALAGSLTSVHVVCTVTTSGTFVGLQGLGMAGTTPVLEFVTVGATSLQVAVETKAAGSFYSAKGAGLATVGANGATVSGDVTETVKAGETAHVLHVAGDATCGTTVHQ